MSIQSDLTDLSVALTLAATAQNLRTANNGAGFLLIQNPTTNIGLGSIWVAFGKDAVQASPSIEIQPGQTMIFEGSVIPRQRVSVIGPTTNMPITAWGG